LHPATLADEELPKPAIRPYPQEYIAIASLADGTPVRLRPIRPEDEPFMVDFHRTLSPESVHYRYFNAYKLESRVAHDRLSRICFNDYDREIALVAELFKNDGAPEILGVGRLIKGHGVEEAEFAIIISDTYQGKGLGGQILDRLIAIARSENLARLTAHILPDNRGMLRLCRKAGFRMHHDYDKDEYFAELKLSGHED
jgi:acetyltransferase